MKSVLDIENAAAQLRHDLMLANLPELKLLCGLKFFKSIEAYDHPGVESYIREFAPSLAETAKKSTPREFLPDEIQSLEKLFQLFNSRFNDVVCSDDLSVLSSLITNGKKEAEFRSTADSKARENISITCLFIEHYPDLSLSPRGRILNMIVKASKIPSTAREDDIVVRNPVSEPDDRFLSQACQSIKVARQLLLERYGLSERKRFRFDYSIESTGARFTGDSLGVAFGIGAMIALAQTEVFHDRLSISPHVAFSGALSCDGIIMPVDSEALTLKLQRAFHSAITHLVIPREHMAVAMNQVSRMEEQHPEQRLDLIGMGNLEEIISDPRLVSIEHLSIPRYLVCKTWRAKRSIWIEGLALIVLLVTLICLVLPGKFMPWFDTNPFYAISNPNTNSLEAYNRDSVLIWSDVLECAISPTTSPAVWSTSYGQTYDFDKDGRNEIVFLPRIDEFCADRSFIRYYSHDGHLIWKRYAAILGKYPGDTAGVQYDAGYLKIIETGGRPIIVSITNQEMPARSHIQFWNSNGESVGWYLHWGHVAVQNTLDIDKDGNKEILFTGFNNIHKCTSLLVLALDSISGFSPLELGVKDKYPWWTSGNQLAYILFPKTDIGNTNGELPIGYNSPGPNGIRLSDDGQIQVYISETEANNQRPQLIYTIDNHFRVIRVAMNDFLIAHRNQLINEGKLPSISDRTEYLNSIRNAVIYWTDSGWMTEGQLRKSEN
ncbi:MAG: hypothetical protein R3F48_08400 [Candidatus Zixiibacteriota bacterium]